MRVSIWVSFLVSALIVALPASAGKLYKWVDEKGITHYGDYVPPEYAKRERAVLNQEGVVIRHLDAEKTPEQRAADALSLRDAESRKQHDQFLLNTYTSGGDIETLRDLRLEQIVGQFGIVPLGGV